MKNTGRPKAPRVERTVWMTVALDTYRHTTGRPLCQAQSERPKRRGRHLTLVSQVAVEPEARVFATSGAQSDGPAPLSR